MPFPAPVTTATLPVRSSNSLMVFMAVPSQVSPHGCPPHVRPGPPGARRAAGPDLLMTSGPSRRAVHRRRWRRRLHRRWVMVELSKAPPGTSDELVRARALKRLRKRRDLAAHAIVYVLVNGFIVVIWLMTSGGGFFWPAFVMAAWGIGLVMNAWDVWRGDEFSEDQVAREIARIAARERRAP